MALVHILDRQKDEIIGTLNSRKGEFMLSSRRESEDNINQLDFTALKHFDKLQKRNRLGLLDKDGKFHEFIIFFAEQNKRSEKIIKSDGSYLDLQKAKVIQPQTLNGATAATATDLALDGTEWQRGVIEYNGIRTINIEEHTNPWDFLKVIASTFGLELSFRVEVDGNRIIGRYVDLLIPKQEFSGKETTFGKDLIGIRRVEDSKNIVTALLGVGPERDDGTRLTVFVENEAALQRWGRKGQHLIEVYEPESTDTSMTESRLRSLTEAELKKRIDAAVIYECAAASIEHIFGREHEKVRKGYVIRVKDTGYTPALYLEARISEVEFDPISEKVLSFKIGSFKEFTRQELEKQVQTLKALMKQKASTAKVAEALLYAEEKAKQAQDNAMTYTDEVAVVVESNAADYANEVAKAAEENAKKYTESYAEQAIPDVIPAKPVNVKATGLFKNIAVEWTMDTANYIANYEVYASKTAGFTPGSTTLVYKGKTSAFVFKAATNEKWYFRIRAINAHGKAGAYSDEIAAQTIQADAKDIAPKTITNELIAENAAIDFAKIANVEITNAHISERLSASKIILGPDSSFEPGYDPTKIQVGGRNLILDSNNFPMNGSDQANKNLTTILQDVNGENYHSVTTAVDGNIYWSNGMKFSEARKIGETYTFSFDVMTTQTSNWGFYFYTDTNRNVSGIPSTNGQWVRYTYTFTQTETKNNSILFGFRDLKAGTEVGWRKLKLEKGNKATDWTPAPEDTDAKIDKAQSDASAAKGLTDRWKYQNTTYIDGGNIYANSVTANKLNVTSLDAISADLGRVTAGELVGVTGTFRGSLEAATVSVTNPNFADDGFVKFRLDRMDIDPTSAGFRRTGYVDITSEYNQLVIRGRSGYGDTTYGTQVGLTVEGHFEALRVDSPMITASERIEVGSFGGIFRATTNAFIYKNDPILRGKSNTVKCTYSTSGILSARLTGVILSSGSNTRIIATPEWTTGSTSMRKIGLIYTEWVDRAAGTVDIKVYVSPGETFVSTDFIYINYMAAPSL